MFFNSLPSLTGTKTLLLNISEVQTAQHGTTV